MTELLAYLAAHDIDIVSASIGSNLFGRGDGSWSSDEQPVQFAVEYARRELGILWVNSAGNAGATHYTWQGADADGDLFVEFVPGDDVFG